MRKSLWDRLGPGTFHCSAAMFAPGHTSPRATKYKETVLKNTAKNSCVHEQLGQIPEKRSRKTKKTQLPLLKSLEQKTGHWACPLHTPPPKGWTNHLSHPSGLTPGHTPTLTPYEKQVCHPLREWTSKGTCCVFCRSRGRNKALPEFLVWPLVNFYWLGKANNPCQ